MSGKMSSCITDIQLGGKTEWCQNDSQRIWKLFQYPFKNQQTLIKIPIAIPTISSGRIRNM